MRIRQRKFVGLVAMIVFLVAYALIAMGIGGQYVVGHGAAIELPAFILLGIGWIPVAMVLIRWMSRPDTES
jgi:Zn-dependent protease with chaperone function